MAGPGLGARERAKNGEAVGTHKHSTAAHPKSKKYHEKTQDGARTEGNTAQTTYQLRKLRKGITATAQERACC